MAEGISSRVRGPAGGLLDATVIRGALYEHRARRGDHAELLYAALVLDRWFRRWAA